MRPLEVHYTLLAPPAVVFAELADLETHARWSGQDSIRNLTPGPPRVGSVFESRGPRLFRRGRAISRITRLEPPRYLEFESTENPFLPVRWTWSYSFSPEAANATAARHALEAVKPLAAELLAAYFFRRALLARMVAGQTQLIEHFNTPGARRRHFPGGAPGTGPRGA